MSSEFLPKLPGSHKGCNYVYSKDGFCNKCGSFQRESPKDKAIGWSMENTVRCNTTLSSHQAHVEAYEAGYRRALKDAADSIWSNRYEPPYTVENSYVQLVESLGEE